MKIFSADEINSNKIARALNDLQRGLPLTINKEYLIAPVETLYERDFNRLKAFFKDKLILIKLTSEHYVAQKAHDFSFKKIKSFCEHNKSQNMFNTTSNISVVELTTQNRLFIKDILTIAKLLPVFLAVKLEHISVDMNNEFMDPPVKPEEDERGRLSCFSSRHSCEGRNLEINDKPIEPPVKTEEDERECLFIGNHIANIEPQDLQSYKAMITSTVEQIITNIPVHLKHTGTVLITMFRVMSTGEKHIVIASKNLAYNKTPLVRLHSSCFTGDLLQSLQCDCNSQLLAAIKLINEKPENAGIVIYLSQEGRGIGLANKLRAYYLQNKGYDTVEANLKLGFDIDERNYSIAAEILRQLKIKTVKLLTNNPKKSEALKNEGIAVVEVLPLITETNNYNKKYMETKKHKMSHTI